MTAAFDLRDWTFSPLTEAYARAIIAWHYPPPYDVYNFDATALPLLIDGRNQYYAVVAPPNELVGFCCFGAEAQVPGANYSANALDVGWGKRPDLVGHGQGQVFVERVLAWAAVQFTPTHFRLTVATWNRRAIRVYERVGLQTTITFNSTPGATFMIMVRPA